MLTLKKIKYFLILFIVLIVSGCGSGLDCADKKILKSINDTTLVNSFNVQTYFVDHYKFVLHPKIKIEIDGVHELEIAENKKSKTCTAEIKINVPKVERSDNFVNLLLKGFLRSLNNEQQDIAQNKTGEFRIKYSVLKLDKKNSSGENVELQYIIKDFEYPSIWLVYKNLQLAGSSIARPLTNIADSKWDSDYIKQIRKGIEEISDIPSNEKKIRLCTFDEQTKKIPFDTFLAFTDIQTDPSIIGFVAASGYNSKPPFCELLNITMNARKTCGANDPGFSKNYCEIKNSNGTPEAAAAPSLKEDISPTEAPR